MAISWASIRSLVIFFGPILLPKAISYYRSVRAAPKLHGLAIKPLSPAIARALFILGAVALVFLLKSLPVFAPENLFVATQSRLQIPVDTLFNRVAAIRAAKGPGGHAALTARDVSLRTKFVNLESRLLYLQFGPDVLADCPFCSSDEPSSYLYYAVPALLAPHLVNLLVLALATSSVVTGREGAQWRTPATIAAVTLCLADVYFVQGYNYQANARALRLQELDHFFWTMRVYRQVALAALDGLAGWLLWLSSTNRAFVRLPSTAERVENVNRALAGVKSKLNALGIVKNTTARDEELRSRSQAYWTHEVRLMSEVMEERDVIEGMNDALQNRVNMQSITRDADVYASAVCQVLQPPGQGDAPESSA